MNITAFIVPLTLAIQVAPTNRLVEGSYLRVDYIRSIKQTRSPYKAVGKGGILQFDITSDNGSLALATIANFHDTGGTYRFKSGDTFQRVDSDNPLDSVTVSPSTGPRFKLIYPKDFIGEFEFVGSMDDFLRSNTIAGEYVDSVGNRYIFRPNGEATFPTRNFKYTVGCDHFEAPFDFIYGDGFDWAFKFQGSTLQFFRHTDEGVHSKPEKKPFLVLKRVNHQ